MPKCLGLNGMEVSEGYQNDSPFDGLIRCCSDPVYDHRQNEFFPFQALHPQTVHCLG